VELFTASAETVNPDTLSRLPDENDMQLAAVATSAGKVLHQLTPTGPDKAVRRLARDFISAMIEFSGRLGARIIIGSIQGSREKGIRRDQALAWLAKSLEELGPKAAAWSGKLLFEPLNRYETVAAFKQFMVPALE